MRTLMEEKYRQILELVYENFLSKDGFKKCRAAGKFVRQKNGFDQRIDLMYQRAGSTHYYGLRGEITCPEFDRLYSKVTEEKQKNVALMAVKPDVYDNNSNQMFWRGKKYREYAFYERNSCERIAAHIYREITSKICPKLDEYADYGRMIRAYELGEEAWRECLNKENQLTGRLKHNEQKYKIFTVCLVAGYVYPARLILRGLISSSKGDWDLEAERERLLGLSEDFYDREDYTLFCVGHMEDRYVMRFINPTGEMVMQKIERMTGGYQDSTAILEYRDDGSYFQIGGTPGGYTAEIRLYDRDGSFVHKKARYRACPAGNERETITIDGGEVEERRDRILTSEDAAACAAAFRRRKEFPEMVEWDDITDWFISE